MRRHVFSFLPATASLLLAFSVFSGKPVSAPIPRDWTDVGEAAGNAFGVSLASAGDVNGDGYVDLAVGASSFDNGIGKVYVYYGSAAGFSHEPGWSAVGESPENWFGGAIASAGDVNGDGYADLAVGAEGFNNSQGKVYVFHGSAGGLSAGADWSAAGDGGSFAYSLDSAGDVNGDGYADLVVGAHFENGAAGRAYVYHGSIGGLSQNADWTAAGEGPYHYFGLSVASAGDFNGDGYADLAVGAHGYRFSRGKVYVYHGSPSGLSLIASWTAVGEAPGYLSPGFEFGRDLASAGDVNGDGYADLVVGAYAYSSPVTSLAGKAYVFHGSSGGLSGHADWSAASESISSLFGFTVASAGDMNGDGYADLAVGALGDNDQTGKVHVFFGSAGGLIYNTGWSVVGEAPDNRFGSAMASAGDVNGDGYADLAVGAWGYENVTGKAYVYQGTPICAGSCLRVSAIRMWVDPASVFAAIRIRDEAGLAVPGVSVSVNWDLPGGGAMQQIGVTDPSGSVTFQVDGGSGTFTITVTDAALVGYTFDPANSVLLSKSITK